MSDKFFRVRQNILETDLTLSSQQLFFQESESGMSWKDLGFEHAQAEISGCNLTSNMYNPARYTDPDPRNKDAYWMAL